MRELPGPHCDQTTNWIDRKPAMEDVSRTNSCPLYPPRNKKREIFFTIFICIYIGESKRIPMHMYIKIPISIIFLQGNR